MTIGERIKQRRLELGFSYRDLEKMTGVSASTLCRYENGTIIETAVNKLQSIAKGLRVSPSYLAGWD